MMQRLWLCCLLLAVHTGVQAQAPAAPGSTQVLFSPWDDVEGEIIRTLGSARQTIHVQAYLLTSRSIAKALLAAHQRGISVSILADAEMALKGDSSQVPKLAAAGIPVWLEVRYVNAHNRIMLVDVNERHPVVLTGSYNFTWSAQARNAENLLILRDNLPLAATYFANWQRHQRDARPFPKDS